jgi:hypothetical protein
VNNSHSAYLKPEPGKLYSVQLKYPTPKEVKGFNGPELRWILMTGQALYTPMSVGKKIEELKLKAGERFEFMVVRQGRENVWNVERPSPQPVAAILNGEPSLDAVLPEQEATSKLELALKTAVNAAAKAEDEGRRIGYTIRFQPADIRAMAISVLIQDRYAA